MISKNSWYVGEIYIPHAKPSITDGVTGVAGDMLSFIDQYEQEAIIKCFGYQLGREFISVLDITKTNGLVDLADTKWDELLNGKEYINPQGVLVKWEGVRRKFPLTATEPNFSLLCFYVYWFYEKNDHITRSGSGNQRNSPKNARVDDSFDKVTNAWRKFVKMVQGEELAPIIIEKEYGFGIDWYQGGQEISLYKFIEDSNILVPNTYPNFNPKKWKNVNQLGI